MADSWQLPRDRCFDPNPAVRGIVDEVDAREMMLDLAYRLAKRAYKFGGQ
ncbi:MAG: hypothetical protein R6X31_10165 [Anaerolineae bacterium]